MASPSKQSRESDRRRPAARVVVGKDGVLFIEGGAHDPGAFARGEREPTPASVRNFAANLRRRARQAKAINARYGHVVFPDKQSVYDDLCPYPVVQRLGELYSTASDGGQDCVYPLGLLRELGRDAYLRLDSHLTDGAALVVYEALFGKLGLDLAHHAARLRSQIDAEETYNGDLGRRFEPTLVDKRIVVRVTWPLVRLSNQLRARNDGIVEILLNREAPSHYRVLIFGDSFFRSSLTLLSYFFEQVYFFRTRYLHREILRTCRPDIVLTGNVERYLSSVKSDELAPQFLLYPYMGAPKRAAYRPSRRFVDALNGILSYGRRPYRDFARAYGLSAPRK